MKFQSVVLHPFCPTVSQALYAAWLKTASKRQRTEQEVMNTGIACHYRDPAAGLSSLSCQTLALFLAVHSPPTPAPLSAIASSTCRLIGAIDVAALFGK